MQTSKQKPTVPPCKTSILKRTVSQSIALIVLASLTLTIASYVTTGTLIRKRTYSQLSSLISAKEELISTRLSEDRMRTALLSSRDEVHGGSRELKVLLEAMQEEGVAALGISVFTRSGSLRAQTGLPVESRSADATILVPEKGQEGWDGYTVYSPIDDQSILAIRYSLRAFLDAFLAVPSLGETGEVLIASQQEDELILLNHSFAPGKRSPLSLGSLSDHLAAGLPIAEAVAKREGVRVSRNYAGKHVISAFRQIPSLGWGLSVSMEKAAALQGVRTMAVTLALLSTLLVVVSSLAALHLARNLTAPIRHLTKRMRKLGPGHWSMGRVIKTGDEVEVLEHIAVDMSKRLKRIYDHLEEEVADRTEELRQQYERDRIILASVDTAVILMNREGKIENANPAAVEMLRCPADACSGEDYKKLIDIRLHRKSLPKKDHPIANALRYGREMRSDPSRRLSVMRHDNILIPIWMVVKPLKKGKTVYGAMVVMQDITEERRVDYLKSEFISLASHQLRTPLSSLQWYAELLGEDKDLTPQQKEFVSEMSSAAKRMNNLIDSLLHAARLEGGSITPHKNMVPMNTLLMDLTEELRRSAKEKKIAITVKLPRRQVELNTDSILLHVVFKNLFSNAVKYTKPGGTVSVTMKAGKTHVEIAVSDTGIGIPKKDLKRLFQRLFRASNVLKMDTDGNGLGLFITKMIVDSLKGTIHVKSIEGKGTTFTVRLPMEKAKKKSKRSKRKK